MTDSQRPPPRLVEMSGPAADCLRQVMTDQDRAVLPPRFVRLRERRQRRQERQRALALLATATAAALCVWLAPKHDGAPSISAELPLVSEHGSHAASSAKPAPAEPLRVAEQARPVPTTTQPRLASLHHAASDASAFPARRAAPTAPVAEAETVGSAKACAQVARTEGALPGIACYEKLAQGSGVSAELALFEQARLEGKVLHQPKLALQRLQSYRDRFPSGSLRAEVMLAQIDWLVSSGDAARALQLIDEALHSGLARERKSELEQVRARLAAETSASP